MAETLSGPAPPARSPSRRLLKSPGAASPKRGAASGDTKHRHHYKPKYRAPALAPISSQNPPRSLSAHRPPGVRAPRPMAGTARWRVAGGPHPEQTWAGETHLTAAFLAFPWLGVLAPADRMSDASSGPREGSNLRQFGGDAVCDPPVAVDVVSLYRFILLPPLKI